MPYTAIERDEIKAAVLKLASGTRAVRITTMGKTVEYGQADLAELEGLLARADADVAAEAGMRQFFLTRTCKGL
jgi:C4-type Zn-finger protein